MATYTDGYTCGKRAAHIVTALVIAIIGVVLLVGEYYASSRTQHYIVLVIGILLIVVGLLSLWPILDQPVVEGTPVSKTDNCGWSGNNSCSGNGVCGWSGSNNNDCTSC
jgi:hypothetical protein